MARSLHAADGRHGLDSNPNGVTAARLALPRSRYPWSNERQGSCRGSKTNCDDSRSSLTSPIGSDLPFTGSSSASYADAGPRPGKSGALLPSRSDARLLQDAFDAACFVGDRSQPGRSRRSPLVAIVSESGGRRIWRGEDPVGRRFRMGGPQAPEVQIVGVVADARFRSLIVDRRRSRRRAGHLLSVRPADRRRSRHRRTLD